MDVGIVSYGAYVPRYRIAPQEIGKVWGTDGEALSRGLLIFSKSVPSPDEDVITISVEAARNMMRRVNIDPQDIGVVKSYQGDANVIRFGKKKGKKLTSAEPVVFKDLDETEFGARVEILFDDGSTITISEDTALRIDEMVFDPKTGYRSVRVRLAVGAIRVETAPNKNPKSRFEVITPTLVAGLRGSGGITRVSPLGETNFIGTSGSLFTRPASQRDNPPASRTPVQRSLPATTPPLTQVPPGNMAIAASTGGAVSPPTPTPPAEVRAANAVTTITNPAPPVPVSVAGT